MMRPVEDVHTPLERSHNVRVVGRMECVSPRFGFLLIVRTNRIFTAHVLKVRGTYDMNEYRWILGCSSI